MSAVACEACPAPGGSLCPWRLTLPLEIQPAPQDRPGPLEWQGWHAISVPTLSCTSCPSPPRNPGALASAAFIFLQVQICTQPEAMVPSLICRSLRCRYGREKPRVFLYCLHQVLSFSSQPNLAGIRRASSAFRAQAGSHFALCKVGQGRPLPARFP